MKRFRDLPRACLAAFCILALSACGGDNDDVPEGDFASPAFGAQAEDTFVATLEATPAAQSAQATASTGTGAGTVTLDAETGRLVAVARTDGTTPTALTIHDGANGPIVLTLAETPPGSGIWSTTATLTAEQLAALRAGELYFEAASLAFPEGELRGQIVRQLETGFVPTPSNPQTGGQFGLGAQAALTLAASLRGEFVAPPADSSAQGAAAVIADPDSRLIEVALATSGAAPTSVVVAQGEPGANGAEVLALAETGVGNEAWFGREVLSAEAFDALLAGNLYVLVRSAAFPEGELRGQLLPQQQLTNFPPFTTQTTDVTTPTVPTFTDSGTGTTPIGTPGLGTGGSSGTAGTGSTGIGTSGFGTSGSGTSGLGTASGFGTSGIGTSGLGTSGIGTSGVGTSGIGTSGFGTSGFGTSGFGTSGTTGFDTSTTGAGGLGTSSLSNPLPSDSGSTPAGLATGIPGTSATIGVGGLPNSTLDSASPNTSSGSF